MQGRFARQGLRRGEAACRRVGADGSGRFPIQRRLLAGLRHSYDQAVAFGISVNLSRPWHKGNHPGLVLARRLKRKASQVWLFATRFDVPATNNGSENAVRGYKRENQRLLAHPGNPAAPLPHPLLPHHRPQPRPPPTRRHPRRRQRELLDAWTHKQHDQLTRHP